MSKPLWVNLLWGCCEPELNSGCSVHVLQQKMLKPTPVSTARWIFGVPASIIALCHHSILHNWHGLWHSFVRRGQQNLQQICVTRAACLGTNPWWTTETGKSKSAWAMSLFKHPSVVSLSTPAIFNVNAFFLLFVCPSERKVFCRFVFVLFLLLCVMLRFSRFGSTSRFLACSQNAAGWTLLFRFRSGTLVGC